MLAAAVKAGFVGLLRAPRFLLTVTVTLGVAVGGLVAIGNLLNEVTLRPLRVSDPSKLVAVYPGIGEALLGIPISTLLELKRTQEVFESMCGVSRGVISMEASGQVSRRAWEAVDGDCAHTLGIRASLGRLIGNEDLPTTLAAAPVVVLSHRFWLDAYEGDASIIGRTIRLNGDPVTVIGIGPAQFDGLTIDRGPDMTLPLGTATRILGGRILALWAVGRLRPETTLDDVAPRLRVLWPAAYAATNPVTAGQTASRAGSAENLRIISASRGFSELRDRYDQSLQWLTLLAALLWALTCINVGGLFLIRTIGRDSDHRIHMALGSGRARLVTQLLAESFFVAVAGTMIAIVLGSRFGDLLLGIVWTSSLPATVDISPDLQFFTAAFGLSLLTTLLVSIAPLMFLSTRRLDRLKVSRGSTRTMANWRRAILCAQVSVSFCLLFLAASFYRNLDEIRAIDPGFSREQLSFARLDANPGISPSLDIAAYMRELLIGSSSVHGLQAASFAVSFPTAEVRHVEALVPSIGAEMSPEGSEIAAARDWISPGFFKSTGIGLLGGRDFTWDDNVGRPAVAIVNGRVATLLFPNGDAVGRRLRLPGRLLTIVGIASDASGGDPRITGFPRVFLPVLQDPRRASSGNLIWSADSSVDHSQVRGLVTSLGRHSVTYVRSADEQTALLLARERLLSAVSLTFAGIAGAMVLLGVYGLLSYLAFQRRKEIGVRIAVGASRRSIARMFLNETSAVTLIGIALGLPLATNIASIADPLLFSSDVTGTSTLIGTCVFLAIAMFCGSLWPVIDAARIPPAEALRHE